MTIALKCKNSVVDVFLKKIVVKINIKTDIVQQWFMSVSVSLSQTQPVPCKYHSPASPMNDDR